MIDFDKFCLADTKLKRSLKRQEHSTHFSLCSTVLGFVFASSTLEMQSKCKTTANYVEGVGIWWVMSTGAIRTKAQGPRSWNGRTRELGTSGGAAQVIFLEWSGALSRCLFNHYV